MPKAKRISVGFDYPMHFEHLVCRVLGRKIGYQSAGDAWNIKFNKRYLRRVIREMMKRTDRIEMDLELKDRLLYEFSLLQEKLTSAKDEDNKMPLLIHALWVVSHLLGYSGVDKKIYMEPIFTQTAWGRARRKGIDWLELKNQLMKTRRDVVIHLLKSGLTTSDVAFVLNTTDYEVQKLAKS